MKNKKIVIMQLKEIDVFRLMLDTLSKLISEINWTIYGDDTEIIKKDELDELEELEELEEMKTKNKNKNKFKGVEISTKDTSKTMFVKIEIEDKTFNKFVYKGKKMTLGINLDRLNKILKTYEKEDILELYIDENNKNFLMIEAKQEKKQGRKTLKFPLIDMEYNSLDLKQKKFDKVITLTPKLYKKVFKEIDDFENINIQCSNQKILFTYKDLNNTEINDEYLLNDDGIIIDENESNQKKYEGTFQIKHLTIFTKCSNLCDEIILKMENTQPLTVIFPTKTFGTITMHSSLINPECVKNVDYDYSDDEDEIEMIDNKINKIK